MTCDPRGVVCVRWGVCIRSENGERERKRVLAALAADARVKAAPAASCMLSYILHILIKYDFSRICSRAKFQFINDETDSYRDRVRSTLARRRDTDRGPLLFCLTASFTTHDYDRVSLSLRLMFAFAGRLRAIVWMSDGSGYSPSSDLLIEMAEMAGHC